MNRLLQPHAPLPLLAALPLFLTSALVAPACSESNSGSDDAGERSASNNGEGFWSAGGASGASGVANEYSWDGSWNPESGEFPLDGMLDETHGQLPPGKWGWDGSCDCPGDEGTAIYDNEFVDKGLDFERLEDSQGQLYGWRLISTSGDPMELNHRGDNFDGTPGVDLFDLGSDGQLQGTGPGPDTPGINLGDGPDMLRYGMGWSVDLRVGDELRGGMQDNDLVILGTERLLGTNEYDIEGTTIHTGPGSDLVFCRNFGPAAIDLGNGASGRTDAIDPGDGPDMVVLEGNMRDFRVYGGAGDDVFVWYVEEVDDDRWLGPNFYGGGGWGEAIWAELGTDRLVLVVDAETEIVVERGLHDDNPGSLLSFVYSPYEESIDEPTKDDVFARYYGFAPEGPNGQRTTTLSFRSPDGAVFTHDFYATSVEEIQLGAGEDAIVYDVDPASGQLRRSDAEPLRSIPARSHYVELFESFGR